jgi:hypothetical protein
MRKIIIAVVALVVVAASFGATLWVMDAFFPQVDNSTKPALAELPPLPPTSRPSLVIAPVAISLNAIRTALDAAAPRDFTGKSNNPVSQLLGKAEIGLQVGRGPIAVTGQPELLTATVPINGSLQISGEVGNQAGKVVGGVGGALGNLLGGKVGQEVGQLLGKAINQQAAIAGNVVVNSKPALTSNWRLQPNLGVQMNFGNSALNIAGLRINLANEIKPLLDPLVNKQVAALQDKISNDPMLENFARQEWAKMCRSVALGGGQTGLPELWLELKPVKAFAAQPRIDAQNLTLTIGAQSEARVGPTQTKPTCPFPAQLELVPPLTQGKLAIGIPMDVPFTEINKLIEQQIKGKTFPNDPNASVNVEVRKASLAASGDRLLISLLVKAREAKSWFGFGAEATVHVWGKPVIDKQQQILRFSDLSLAVESEAAFGLLGAAARAAIPYLEDSLKEQAVIDLKPFLADARNKVAEVLADFRQVTPGVTVDAAVNDLRLADIAFDSKTLRIITESEGTAKVTVTQLPK